MSQHTLLRDDVPTQLEQKRVDRGANKRQKKGDLPHVLSLSAPPTNHYLRVQTEFKEKPIEYANFPLCHVNLPFQMAIIGKTGSGKTNGLIELFTRMNCFTRVLLFAKNTDESLYADWIARLRKVERTIDQTIITVSNSLDSLPPVQSNNKEQTTLLVIDDMMNEKHAMLSRAVEYFSMGRKNNVSVAFISQSFFAIPTRIRANCGYFMLFHIATERNLKMIVSEFQMDRSEQEVVAMYRKVKEMGFPNFFLIDRVSMDKRFAFRINYAPFDAIVVGRGDQGGGHHADPPSGQHRPKPKEAVPPAPRRLPIHTTKPTPRFSPYPRDGSRPHSHHPSRLTR